MIDLQTWIDWAGGPLFRAALAFMLLGLARRAALNAWEIVRAWRRAGDKQLPWRAVLRATLRWLFPLGQVGNRALFSATTLLFHAAVILVPLFLAGHVALWQPWLGIAWPVMPSALATALTVAAVVAALGLVIQRAASRATRALSRLEDYALPIVVGLPFLTGLLVMHPGWNPFSYQWTMLAHVLSADLLLVLFPLTKLSHMVLLPATQLVSELAWHFPPDAGSRVAAALRKEGEPI